MEEQVGETEEGGATMQVSQEVSGKSKQVTGTVKRQEAGGCRRIRRLPRGIRLYEAIMR